MSPTDESVESPRKRQKTLSCQRCRSRKQKCSDTRPCYNCITANKECISSEPTSRKSRISTEYTQSLEEKIAELEAQLLRAHQIEVCRSQRQVPDDSTLLNDVDRNSDCNEPEQEQNPVPLLDTGRNSAHTHGLAEEHRTFETQQVQHLVVPACASASVNPFSPPISSLGLVKSPISGDKCGHISLLTSILATLTRGSPCGGHTPGNRPLSHIHLSTDIANQLLNPNYSIRLTDGAEDALIQVYLERVNPRYPFLHVNTFLGWYKTWKGRTKENPTADQKDRWQDFFVTMVQAVSILLTPQVSQNDIATSQILYNTAIKYLSFVFTRPDPVLHVQAHLLLTLHALHSPSSEMIITMVSATMRQCVISGLHLSENEPRALFPEFSQKVQIRRRVFWSAYAIDRLISWIYHIPNNLIDEHITVDLFSNVDDASLSQDTANLHEPPSRDLLQRTRISPALHLIRCRCIQSRIISTMLRSDFPKINSSPTWREHMLEELETWRSQVERLSHRANRGYLSDRWVGMAYNYTMALLHQPTKENVCNGFGDRSLQASVQLALTFRAFQKDRQTAQLWPGLLSQFTVGVTILYCFWATPPAYRPPTYRAAEVSEALRACSTSLAILAERWNQAEPLRDVFDILAKEIPTHEGLDRSPSSKHITSDAVVLIESHMHAVREISRNQVILRMLQEIITDDFPSGPGECLQQKDSPRGNHLCSEHCAMFHGTAVFDAMMNLNFDPHGITTGDLSETYAPFDDMIIFPALFGSAEF